MNKDKNKQCVGTHGWISRTHDGFGSYSNNQYCIDADEYVEIRDNIIKSCTITSNCKLIIHDNGVYSKRFKDNTEDIVYLLKY